MSQRSTRSRQTPCWFPFQASAATWTRRAEERSILNLVRSGNIAAHRNSASSDARTDPLRADHSSCPTPARLFRCGKSPGPSSTKSACCWLLRNWPACSPASPPRSCWPPEPDGNAGTARPLTPARPKRAQPDDAKVHDCRIEPTAELLRRADYLGGQHFSNSSSTVHTTTGPAKRPDRPSPTAGPTPKPTERNCRNLLPGTPRPCSSPFLLNRSRTHISR